MAALTQGRPTVYREGVEMDYPVAGATKIYAGALVCVNSGGYALPAADTAGLTFIGVALDSVDNVAGANGDKVVRVRRTGVFEFDAAGITQGMVGAPMCVVDDHTFASVTGTIRKVRVGVLVKYVSPIKGWIDISK